MTDPELGARVREEIQALHAEFEAWFTGESESLDRVEAVLADDFLLVHPRGGVATRYNVLDGLRSSRGTRQVRIRIEQPDLRWQSDGTVLATYEEWHDHADYTTGRQTSAIFSVSDDAPNGLIWRHVHETWITPPPTWVVPPPHTS